MKPVKFGLSCLFFTSKTSRVDGNAFDRRIANRSYLLEHMTHRISVMTQNVVEFQRVTEITLKGLYGDLIRDSASG